MIKKTVLIVALAITLVGAGIFVVGATVGKKTHDNIIDVFNPDSFKEGASGKIAIDLEQYSAINDSVGTFNCLSETNEYCITFIISGLKLDRFSAGLYAADKDKDGRMLVDVTVKTCPTETRESILDFFVNYYTKLYEITKDSTNFEPEILEQIELYASPEGRAAIDKDISTLMCQVDSSVNFFAFKDIGLTVAIIGALVAIVCALSFKFNTKTIIIGLAGVLLILICITLFAFRKEIATVASLKKYSEGVYSLKCTSDYKLDEILEANITTENELLDWASDEIYHGLPVSMKETLFGCSAFAVTDTEGNHLMGRNTDYPESDCLMIYCDPEDGYDSIGMVDLTIVNIGNTDDRVGPMSAAGRISTLAMPYMIVEGMNEAGFGVSILQLDHEDIHQDTGRKDILLNVAVRAVLDKCATVDEAVAFLDQYDMNTMLGATFHLFMTDKTGKSVVVEWLGNNMNVTENPAITNYIISDTSFYGEENGDGRYEDLMADLDACSCIASLEEAMGFLNDVGYDNKGNSNIGTEWSSVYNLDNFTVMMCFDVNYDAPVIITRDTFK